MKINCTLWIALAMFAVGGCGLNSSNLGYVPQVAPPLNDVPVPVGFSMDYDSSWDRSDGGLRWANHRYSGKGPLTPLANFYEKQMPQTRWALVTKGFAEGRATLDFEKDQERCRITISQGNSLLNTVQIHVDIWTHSTAKTPAAR